MLLERRARALQRHLPQALSGDDHGVHQARVATRRLRETLPVVSAGAARGVAKKARRKIRRLTRALGTVRELDVSLQILDELARRRDVPRRAVEDVRAHVIAEREQRRSKMLRRLEKVDAGKLGRRLGEVASDTTSPTDAWRTELSARVLKRARRLDVAIKAAGHIYAADHLHAVRIAVKKLRYALELAADGGVAGARPLVSMLKRTQETLGRVHDLQILQHHVADLHARTPQSNGQPAPGYEVVAATLEAECRHLHARYVASIEGLREVITRTRTTIVPGIGAGKRTARIARPAKTAAPRRLAAGTA